MFTKIILCVSYLVRVGYFFCNIIIAVIYEKIRYPITVKKYLNGASKNARCYEKQEAFFIIIIVNKYYLVVSVYLPNK